MPELEVADDGSIDVVMHSTVALIEEASSQLDGLEASGAAASEQLDRLGDRVDRLVSHLAIEHTSSSPDTPPSPARRSVVPTRSDEVAHSRAIANLRSRGIDPSDVSIEQLIDPDEAERIRKRFGGEIAIRARLDRFDVTMAIVAGLTGGLVDLLLVNTPPKSPLTVGLKNLAVPSNNWLADLAKVPYDKSWDYELWLTPKYHRVQTVGHDPLLGLVWGTADIMRQTCTGVRPDGTLGVIGNAGEYPSTWPAALARQIMHTLSDAPTASGVPLPGWGLLAGVPTRDGDKNLAQQMYSLGYDSWHFMTMATVPATVEMLCRGYWALRRATDADFDGAIDGPVSEHPRYQALSLAAHGVSASVDLVGFVAGGSNPLALNYAQWVALARQGLNFAKRERQNDMAALALRNQRAIEVDSLMATDKRREP